MKKQFDIALSFAMEEREMVETVYHYLRAERFSVFFAPADECQTLLIGENQREIFYRIFGLETDYVAMFVSKHYIVKPVPMEEAKIAFLKHGNSGQVIPIYLDETCLPIEMLDPTQRNYFRSQNAVEIASYLAGKIKAKRQKVSRSDMLGGKMCIANNKANKQIFIQNMTLEGKQNDG